MYAYILGVLSLQGIPYTYRIQLQYFAAASSVQLIRYAGCRTYETVLPTTVQYYGLLSERRTNARKIGSDDAVDGQRCDRHPPICRRKRCSL